MNLKNSKILIITDENFFSETDFSACIGIMKSAIEFSLYNTPSKIGNANFLELLFLKTLKKEYIFRKTLFSVIKKINFLNISDFQT